MIGGGGANRSPGSGSSGWRRAGAGRRCDVEKPRRHGPSQEVCIHILGRRSPYPTTVECHRLAVRGNRPHWVMLALLPLSAVEGSSEVSSDDERGEMPVKKLLAVLALGAAGFAVWRKVEADKAEQALWAEVTDPVK